MSDQTQQVSIWSSFENLLKEAEQKFFEHDFEAAVKLWQEYAQITGASKWKRAATDLNYLIKEFVASNPTDPHKYFEDWLGLHGRMSDNQLSPYAFHLMERLYAKIFLSTKQTVSFDVATGIFCFIEKRFDKARENLSIVLNQQPDNLLARIYLSKCSYATNEEEQGTAYLSQAMFLASNEILSEDVGSLQIRNLYGRLKSVHGRGEAGVWLVPFEAWYRNLLIWLEDVSFFQVMQQKERNERILQVKYYAFEKYRHFVRCLFIEEYVRHFLPKEKGIIWEQEAYMEKLDVNLYQRYRKKRKPVA
jgi:hypothetical protein